MDGSSVGDERARQRLSADDPPTEVWVRNMAQTRGRPKRGSANDGDGQRQGRGGNGRHFRAPFETKVWHDPLLKPASHKSASDEPASPPQVDAKGPVAAPKRSARIIASPRAPSDPGELERQRLIARVLAAEGRPSITRAADDLLAGGFALPRTQEVWLQLLEHRDETRVCDAITTLRAIFDEDPPLRRAVLDSRLRRIEQLAEENGTKRGAAELRRFLQAKYPAGTPAVDLRRDDDAEDEPDRR
jgi:hypothetical protein